MALILHKPDFTALKAEYDNGSLNDNTFYESLRKIAKGIWRMSGGKFQDGVIENKEKIKYLAMNTAAVLIECIEKSNKKKRKNNKSSFLVKLMVTIISICFAYSIMSKPPSKINLENSRRQLLLL